MEPVPLSALSPISSNTVIVVKIERIFNREFVWIIGPRRSPMKELISIDAVVYDEEGTKMIMRLMSEDARDIFMHHLKEGLTFEIHAPMVETGGEILDNLYHIVLHSSCNVKVTGGFPATFPFTPKIPFQIELGKICPTGFFDIVGFLIKVSPINKIKLNSIWEKQIEVHLGHGIQIVDGTWIEEVFTKLNKVVDLDHPPFIYVRYVVMEAHTSSGSAIVSSYYDATSLDIDPSIEVIQEQKGNLFDMSVEF